MKKQQTVIAVAVIMVAAAVVFISTAVQGLWYAPDQQQSPDSAVTAPASAPAQSADAATVADPPARLIIPSLNINAAAQATGVNAKGNMVAPSNFTDVAWYKYGPAPGQAGGAVIAGHVDNGLALAGVFKHLQDIALGSDIYVTTKQGRKLHFLVADVRSYPYDEVPTQLLFAPGGDARLNLITCDGTWLPTQKTYDHRLVVSAQLQPN